MPFSLQVKLCKKEWKSVKRKQYLEGRGWVITQEAGINLGPGKVCPGGRSSRVDSRPSPTGWDKMYRSPGFVGKHIRSLVRLCNYLFGTLNVLLNELLMFWITPSPAHWQRRLLASIQLKPLTFVARSHQPLRASVISYYILRNNRGGFRYNPLSQTSSLRN